MSSHRCYRALYIRRVLPYVFYAIQSSQLCLNLIILYTHVLKVKFIEYSPLEHCLGLQLSEKVTQNVKKDIKSEDNTCPLLCKVNVGKLV